MDILTRIVEWNKERGLIERGFNHKKEASFIIEELLESTGTYDSLSAQEAVDIHTDAIITQTPENKEVLVDAWADIIVFATGAIAKLGYDPAKVMEEVYKEIDSRTGTLIEGKFVKDPNAKIYTADLAACKIIK